MYVHINMYMSTQLTQSYLKALELVNLSDLSKESGRAYRTLQAYRMGDRRVTEKAAEELVAYLKRFTLCRDGSIGSGFTRGRS